MINLLPSKEKRILVQERKFKITLILGCSFLLALIVLNLGLLGIKFYLSTTIGALEQKIVDLRTRIESPSNKALKKKVTNFNSDLGQSKTWFEDQQSVTKILEHISSLLPKHTYLISLVLQQPKTQVTILGFAPDRQTLFELKKNFEDQPQIKNFHFPPSNWIEPEQIQFNLRFNYVFQD